MLFLCVLKLKNRCLGLKKITPAVIFAVLMIGLAFLSSFKSFKHPYYLSVVDIKYKAPSLEISVRMFTNDLEEALSKTTANKIDLINPSDKPATDSILSNYIKQRLYISTSGKRKTLSYIGFEREEDSIWSYFEIKNIKVSPKQLDINAKILYDSFPSETIIIHCEVNGVKKSSKIMNPESVTHFIF